jgi:hypothetical protein
MGNIRPWPCGIVCIAVLVWIGPAHALCLLGLGSCESNEPASALAGRIVRGVYYLDNDRTWGFLAHFAKSGARCFLFGISGRKSAVEIDRGSSFCFEPTATYVERSPISQLAAVNSQSNKNETWDLFYSAYFQSVGDAFRLQYKMCMRQAGADFNCPNEWTAVSVRIEGNRCSLQVDAKSILGTVKDTSCELYSE